VRIVWFAQLTETFNVSVPWVQVKCIRIRESKYGIALVIETSEFSGAYVLGFRVENVESVYGEISSLFGTFSKKPIFGVQVKFDESNVNIDEVTIPREKDEMEIIETGYEHVRSIQNTYATSKKENKDVAIDDLIEFNDDLGLACEALPEGMKIDQLWKIA
jgi:Bardet-Biedl syndrome 5 protein